MCIIVLELHSYKAEPIYTNEWCDAQYSVETLEDILRRQHMLSILRQKPQLKENQE